MPRDPGCDDSPLCPSGWAHMSLQTGVKPCPSPARSRAGQDVHHGPLVSHQAIPGGRHPVTPGPGGEALGGEEARLPHRPLQEAAAALHHGGGCPEQTQRNRRWPVTPGGAERGPCPEEASPGLSGGVCSLQRFLLVLKLRLVGVWPVRPLALPPPLTGPGAPGA